MVNTMSKASLAHLPSEILNSIGELLARPPDAHALVLTNRRFSTIFINRLYKLGSEVPDCSGGALGWAACQDNLGVAQRAIEAGVNIDTLFKPHHKFLSTADQHWLSESETFRHDIPFAGTFIETRYKDEATPLVLAVRHGNMVMARLLADAGADVNLEPCRGRAPLALTINSKNLPMVKLLAETGRVDWDASHDLHWRALGLAAKVDSLEIVEYLIPKITTAEEWHPMPGSRSALGAALTFKRYRIAKKLLAHPDMKPAQYLLANPLRAALDMGDLPLLEIIWLHKDIKGGFSRNEIRRAIGTAAGHKFQDMVEFLENEMKKQFPESEPESQTQKGKNDSKTKGAGEKQKKGKKK